MTADNTQIKHVRRRDGSLVPFDKDKIYYALYRAFFESFQDEQESARRAEALTQKVVSLIQERFREAPTVEGIQDVVEEVLIQQGYAQVAKSYILYRQ